MKKTNNIIRSKANESRKETKNCNEKKGGESKVMKEEIKKKHEYKRGKHVNKTMNKKMKTQKQKMTVRKKGTGKHRQASEIKKEEVQNIRFQRRQKKKQWTKEWQK